MQVHTVRRKPNEPRLSPGTASHTSHRRDPRRKSPAQFLCAFRQGSYHCLPSQLELPLAIDLQSGHLVK
eukprot:3151150-Amphidinium_carterae.1